MPMFGRKKPESESEVRRLRLNQEAWDYIESVFRHCRPDHLERLDARTDLGKKSVMVRYEPDVELIIGLLVSELGNSGKRTRTLRDEINVLIASVNSAREQYEAAERQMDSLRTQHITELSKLHGQYRQREHALELQHQNTLDRLQSGHRTKTAESERKFASDLSRMEEGYRIREERFRQEVDGLSAALIDQDNSYQAKLGSSGEVERLGDESIRSRYQDLLQYIDQLTRIEWKEEQSVWTNQLLHELKSDQTPRKLKNYILQDSLWFHLHERIFCTPFRVFGDEGTMLEQQWSDRFGQDTEFDNGLYCWPTTSIEAERWRYETIRECRMALMQPTSAMDPRAKLKKGFKKNTDNLKAILKSTLNEMTYLSSSDAETVDALVKRATNIWLELGMQRYRIMMVVPGSKSKSITDRVRGGGGRLDLTMAPTLQRHGNAKGYELGLAVVVAGCEGQGLTLNGN